MKTALALTFIFGAYVVASNAEYNDKKAAEQERKSLNQGRVWSKKCEKAGMDVIATKKDQEQWKLICVQKKTLKV